jgi:hypothetical protein
MRWWWQKRFRPADPVLWSPSPGPNERHLRRRYRNPLFPNEAREVSQRDIDDACAKDRSLLNALRRRFRELLEVVANPPDSITLKEGTKLMLEFDELREEFIAEGSEALSWLPDVERMETALAQTIESALADQPEMVAKYRAAEEMRLGSRALLVNPVVIEFSRVPPEDLAATVASANPEHISVFLRALHGTPAQQVLRDAVSRLLVAAVADGFSREAAAEKLAVLQAPAW